VDARWLALGLLVSVSACGGGGGGSKGIGLEDLNKDGQVVILCFGDSITYGIGDGVSVDVLPPNPSGYPKRLPDLLIPKSKIHPVIVIDDGNPGERTPGGVVRLGRDLGSTPADYVILLEGTNDVQDGHTRQAVSNMQLMVEAVFAKGAQPILGTITPSCCDHKNQLPIGAEEAYNAQLRMIAFNESIPLIDFFAAFTNGPGPNGEDLPFDPNSGLIIVPEGLHPTAAGYDLMAATVEKLFFP